MEALIIIGLIVVVCVFVASTSTERRVMHDVDKLIKENERDLKRRINKEYGNGNDLIK